MPLGEGLGVLADDVYEVVEGLAVVVCSGRTSFSVPSARKTCSASITP